MRECLGRNRQSEGGHDRVGMRFLEIDAKTISKLDHYVNDNFPRNHSAPA